MSYSLDEIKQKLQHSLDQLWRQDKHLLCIDANERSITHRLAIYLEKEFGGYNVDCEYNREGDDPKRLLWILNQSVSGETQAYNLEATSVFPDIIVHKRGDNQDNLLVIEVKKLIGESMGIDSNDKDKLIAFLGDDPLNYKYGLALQIPEKSGNVATLFWFEQGRADTLIEEEYSIKP